MRRERDGPGTIREVSSITHNEQDTEQEGSTGVGE
jgi:hypothetical protein